MHVIAIISQKGGSGKTTLATALAVAHEEAGGTAAVADLDPQGSSVAWHHFRSGAPPIVAAVHPPRLERSSTDLAKEARGVDLLLLGRPNRDIMRPIRVTAAERAAPRGRQVGEQAGRRR